MKNCLLYLLAFFPMVTLISCSTNKIDEKVLEKKWRVNVVYCKVLDNYIAARKAACDTIKRELSKMLEERDIEDYSKELLCQTMEFRANGFYEQNNFVKRHLFQIPGKWFITGDGKIIINASPQKEETINVKDSIKIRETVYYYHTEFTRHPDSGQKDTFNITKLTDDTLMLTGRMQFMINGAVFAGNGTIILKPVK